MTIKARKLKESEVPGKTVLYVVKKSCDIIVEEKQTDGSLDQVTLEYHIDNDDFGYFAKEYRPPNVQKMGAKVIDITAVMLKGAEKSIKWYLYDIKDTMAGEHTVVQLFDQWNFGLQYLQETILSQLPEYLVIPDLGVITRCYDEERMKRLRDKFQKLCNDVENEQQRMSLSQRKKRTAVAKYRAVYKAAQAILDRHFQMQSEEDTYEIHIRQLSHENDRVYKTKLFV